MLDHMVECSGLRRSTGELSKSVKGNWYYRVLQMGRGKRDASPAIVTAVVDRAWVGTTVEQCFWLNFTCILRKGYFYVE